MIKQFLQNEGIHVALVVMITMALFWMILNGTFYLLTFLIEVIK